MTDYAKVRAILDAATYEPATRAMIVAYNLAPALLAVAEAAEAVTLRGEDDWACVKCLPDSDVLVEGFLCRPHTLRAALAALDAEVEKL